MISLLLDSLACVSCHSCDVDDSVEVSPESIALRVGRVFFLPERRGFSLVIGGSDFAESGMFAFGWEFSTFSLSFMPTF
eukprot:22548_3